MFAQIGEGLAARGHTVTMLVPPGAPTAGEFSARGLAVREIPVTRTGISGVLALRRALAGLGATILVVDRARDLRLAAGASLLSKVSILHCNTSVAVPRDLASRFAYRRVALATYLSASLAARALAAAPWKARVPRRVIANGIDLARFSPRADAGAGLRERLGIGARPLLVAVSALTAEKRVDVLLAAAALLGDARPVLAVAGEGPERPALESRARALALDVRWLGHVPPDDLPGWYNAATAFVHACPVEAFGLAIAEAMACARPVVVVDGGGVSEVVGDAGVLVAAPDPVLFAAALRGLLGDPARRRALGEAARRRAEQRFSLERLQREYADAVESLA